VLVGEHAPPGEEFLPVVADDDVPVCAVELGDDGGQVDVGVGVVVVDVFLVSSVDVPPLDFVVGVAGVFGVEFQLVV
jgi:hypothetical protein